MEPTTNTQKSESKLITIDVNEESFDKGYVKAIGDCAKPSELYLGHTARYWGDFAVGWVPFILMVVAYFIWAKRCMKKTRNLNDIIIERQLKALEGMEKTNQLLAEISQKLDKR